MSAPKSSYSVGRPLQVDGKRPKKRGAKKEADKSNSLLSNLKKASNTRNAVSSEEMLHEKELMLRRLELDLNKREVQLKPLSGLYRVIKAMATTRRLDALLEVITHETQLMLRCDRCSVFVLDTDRQELWSQVAQGIAGVRTLRIPLSSTSIIGECARAAKAINIEDAYEDNRFNIEIDQQTGYRTRSVLCVPMLNRDSAVIGVFEVLNKIDGSFTRDDEDWLEGLSAVAAGLIEQAQSYAEIERFVDKMVETLARTIDKRDPLTAGHSMRVMRYSSLIGQSISIPEEEIDVLRYAALMHDYGKIGVPEAILWKNGRLTPEEYKIVQRHASITFELLSSLPFTQRLRTVPYIASCHHEKVDGTGYYRGLKNEEIPFLSRIIAVADVFDALTSQRHYRNRMPIDKVSEIMQSGRDHHFDAQCVDAFYRLPSHQVLQVLESERDRTISLELEMFKHTAWKRLTEILMGSRPKKGEEGLKESFESIYNSGLPVGYQALD